MNTLKLITIALLLSFALVACDQTAPVGPISPTAPSSVQPPTPPLPPPQTVVSDWQGSSRVVSVEHLPACVPEFWQIDFADSIFWQLLKSDDYRPEQFDFHLRQNASGEFCHLNASINGNEITAKPWDNGLGGPGGLGQAWCHYRLDTSGWGCPSPAPEVWIEGIILGGVFTDAAESRSRGTMDVEYVHRYGSGSYTTAKVRKLFDVVKSAP